MTVIESDIGQLEIHTWQEDGLWVARCDILDVTISDYTEEVVLRDIQQACDMHILGAVNNGQGHTLPVIAPLERETE